MGVTVLKVDYGDAAQADALCGLMNIYASDPMGGGKALAPEVLRAIVPGLAALPTAFSLLAYAEEEAVGLTNCFFGFSTFEARPLVNIHDIVVDPRFRNGGVARALFGRIEEIALAANACKVTLEVLSGNAAAKKLYSGLGYQNYSLDPATGNALFWQKRLAA